MSISKDALKEETHVWESMGAISTGGTVFGVAVSPVDKTPRYWASTGCGDKTDGNRTTVLHTLKSTGIGVPGSCLLKAQNVPETSDRSATFSITHLVWKSMSNS